jgi:hypothetical protein
MVSKRWASNRAQAVRLGDRLLRLNAICHVVHEHGFKDEFLFYRFREGDLAPPFAEPEGWTFSERARRYSMALSACLARRLEAACDRPARYRALRELRSNLLYLTVQHDSTAWELVRSHNGEDTFCMERLHIDNSVGDGTPVKAHTRARTTATLRVARAGLAVFRSKISKTVSVVGVSPQRFLHEWLDFRSRARWEPLLQEARVLANLPGGTRIVHRCGVRVAPSAALTQVLPRQQTIDVAAEGPSATRRSRAGGPLCFFAERAAGAPHGRAYPRRGRRGRRCRRRGPYRHHLRDLRVPPGVGSRAASRQMSLYLTCESACLQRAARAWSGARRGAAVCTRGAAAAQRQELFTTVRDQPGGVRRRRA